jgi:hypothetical protein
MKTFPVLFGSHTERQKAVELGCPLEVDWGIVARHEAQCLRNHDQGVKRLAERGGLHPTEMCAVLEDRRWRPMPLEDAITDLLRLLAKER